MPLRSLSGAFFVCVLSLNPSILASEPLIEANLIDEFRNRVAIGEFEYVASEMSSYINEIRTDKGNYDTRLYEPYMLLGDAQLGLEEPDDAVESFKMALHVRRMNAGLSSTDQIDALYRLSEAMVVAGDYENANKSQERAYALMLDEFGTENPHLLPSMLKLIEWYESNRRYWAAKILYLDAFKLINRVIPTEDKRRVELARSFAIGMRNTVFPPMSGAGQFRGFEIEIPGYEPPSPGTPRPSSYALGQIALTNVVDFIEKQPNYDPKELAVAKLHLADWHQLFGRESKATRLYRELWLEMAAISEFRDSIFGQPKLLYIRLPDFTDETSTESTGLVELLLTVSYRGTVTGRISQVVDPPDQSIEFRTRVAAREARFRPALDGGKPVTTRDFRLTHRYPLPSRRPR